MSSSVEIASSFIEGAPPGESLVCANPYLPGYGPGHKIPYIIANSNVQSPDIKVLTSDGPNIIPELEPAFRSYNEKQLATVKLPGSSQQVIVSEFNRLDGDRYYDVESSTSFEFDHITQTASAAQSYPLDSQNADLVKSLLRSLSTHAKEHYPSSSYGVYPVDNDTAIAIVVVANRYSPNNFWNGRYRSIYQIPVSSSSTTTITGNIHIDVHYYEDGNVALSTTKPISIPLSNISAESIMSKIGAAERDHQEELNRAFSRLAEGAFKSLRRQLPITRQKVEWERVGGYRLGQDISGGKGK
ncbi:F-actin capping protein alpha subunit, putative [Talaromyces stipitatus ATCC 10500]|uniref:F-actin-capping protein subunit alpha n=1 Tax=Talaromyces stipitatus (strain ATCC 10500 / CBS 375.48 / QM 6759 / NRRL 1006) TaxID=441959 RepID=B8LZ33_TALSN|nr:F-actin capping protein alpha subunit, putative [Talaromyces stipitatus ATCC 10500]EED21077.1 F-actin capping protein alpha subunit, putative [Talaromyces stipitatus ATCC 10500]